MMKTKVVLISVLLSISSLAVCSAKGKVQTDTTKFDRGIELPTSVFIPKGTVGTGLSFSYNTTHIGQSADDAGYSLLGLITGISGDLNTFGLSPHVSYFIADNLSLGARFDYSRTSLNVGNVGLSLGDLLSLQIADYHYIAQNYTAALTMRYYMPFAKSKRFGMFVEGRLTGGYGQSKTYKVDGEDKFGSYQDIYKASLDFVPGLAAFVTNNVALEVSVGILGVDYKMIKQVTNQVENSVMQNSGANFKLNLLSINIGLAFYIPTGNNKSKK